MFEISTIRRLTRFECLSFSSFFFFLFFFFFFFRFSRVCACVYVCVCMCVCVCFLSGKCPSVFFQVASNAQRPQSMAQKRRTNRKEKRGGSEGGREGGEGVRTGEKGNISRFPFLIVIKGMYSRLSSQIERSPNPVHQPSRNWIASIAWKHCDLNGSNAAGPKLTQRFVDPLLSLLVLWAYHRWKRRRRRRRGKDERKLTSP